jgi:hypothetical protein
MTVILTLIVMFIVIFWKTWSRGTMPHAFYFIAHWEIVKFLLYHMGHQCGCSGLRNSLNANLINDFVVIEQYHYQLYLKNS